MKIHHCNLRMQQLNKYSALTNQCKQFGGSSKRQLMENLNQHKKQQNKRYQKLQDCFDIASQYYGVTFLVMEKLTPKPIMRLQEPWYKS